jgi:hypothetical protein
MGSEPSSSRALPAHTRRVGNDEAVKIPAGPSGTCVVDKKGNPFVAHICELPARRRLIFPDLHSFLCR